MFINNSGMRVDDGRKSESSRAKRTKKADVGRGGGGGWEWERGPGGAVSSPSQWDRGKAPQNFELSVSKTLNSDISGNHFGDIN